MPAPSTSLSGTGGSEEASSSIKVFLRCRPHPEDNEYFTPSLAKSSVVIAVPDDFLGVASDNERFRNTEFNFHGILDENATQADVFEVIAQDCVGSVVEGVNSTIFAYGQAGAGKTYSLRGPGSTTDGDGDGAASDGGAAALCDDDERGMIPRVLEELFAVAGSNVVTTTSNSSGVETSRVSFSNTSSELAVSLSYLEIFNDCGRDLLLEGGDDGDGSVGTGAEAAAAAMGGATAVSPDAADGSDRGGGGGSRKSSKSSRSKVGRSNSGGPQSSLTSMSPRSPSSGSDEPSIVRRTDQILQERRRSSLLDTPIGVLKDLLLREFSEAEFRSHRGAIVQRLRASTIEAVATADGGVECRNLSTHRVASLPEALAVYAKGNAAHARAVRRSKGLVSRSHLIFTVSVESRRPGASDVVRKVSGLVWMDEEGLHASVLQWAAWDVT
jgi:hypothetical protein